MRSYGVVYTEFWVDEDISGLSDKAKLLALYLISGPHTNVTGCFRLPPGYIQDDMGWDARTVTQTVSELLGIGFIERCKNTHLTLIPNFLTYNPIANPNVGKRVAKEVRGLPKKNTVFQRLVECLEPFEERLPEGFLNGLLNGMANHEQEQEQEQTHNRNIEQEPCAPAAAPTFDDEFNQFKRAYPDRGGAAMGWKEAKERFVRLVRTKKATPGDLILSARRYAEAMKGKRDKDRSGIQQASTFLGDQKSTWSEYLPARSVGTSPMALNVKVADDVPPEDAAVWREVFSGLSASARPYAAQLTLVGVVDNRFEFIAPNGYVRDQLLPVRLEAVAGSPAIIRLANGK